MPSLLNQNPILLKSQFDTIVQCVKSIEEKPDQDAVEEIIAKTFSDAPEGIVPDSERYYSVFNYHLYRFILKYYREKSDRVCLWRFIKNLSDDQLNFRKTDDRQLVMMDNLIRIYFNSGPLDDLTCIFIPITDSGKLQKYLDWIKNYFYDADYPTSLLWLYALDSSLSDLFPEEIVFFGKRKKKSASSVFYPDFEDTDTVLLKRMSEKPGHYIQLQGTSANNEFRQIFSFLEKEYRDRCLSRSMHQEPGDPISYRKEWEKFSDVLRFGVSDRTQKGSISFSDMRSSTEFLNTFGKSVFLNKIQQPFFEQTKYITSLYRGRIDKFMGDNVMCVFLNDNMAKNSDEENENETILNIFFALFHLCKVLYSLLVKNGWTNTRLGLRSGLTYGTHVLRSNLGNEIMRDFTVTGETVNLAARLEHFRIDELITQNLSFFKKSIERFPQINDIVSITGENGNLNPETQSIIQNYTVCQNILSNLEKLKYIRFDIRCNQDFYEKLKGHFLNKGFSFLNEEKADVFGYDEFDIKGTHMKFYYSYFNPKGFREYEKIWIIPLDDLVFSDVSLEDIR